MLRLLHAGPCLALLFLGGCATVGSDQTATLLGQGSLTEASTRAQAALTGQRYDEARAAFAQVLRADTGNLEARLGMADAELALGASTPAREAFASLAAHPPVRSRALQGLGLANLRLGDKEGARTALQTAVEEDPKLWRAWSGLARLHDSDQAWDLAATAYTQALANAPNREVVLNNWGMSLLARGEPAEAAKRFEEALRVRVDFPTARANLRLALAMAGQEQHVLAQANANELPQVLNNLGYLAMVQGDLPRAEAYFYQAIEESPSFYQRAYENLQRLDLMREQVVPGTSS